MYGICFDVNNPKKPKKYKFVAHPISEPIPDDVIYVLCFPDMTGNWGRAYRNNVIANEYTHWAEMPPNPNEVESAEKLIEGHRIFFTGKHPLDHKKD
jgi:hypothetical protein